MQRILGQVEVAKDTNQSGEDPPAIDSKAKSSASPTGSMRPMISTYISATGRTSTDPNLAEGIILAALNAWSRVSVSIK